MMSENENIEVAFAGGTDRGKVRKQNEDCVLLCEFEHSDVRLCVVADGVGGHEGGAVASKLAVESIKSSVEKSILQVNSGGGYTENWLSYTLQQAIEDANQRIVEQQVQTPFSQMATTVVAMLIKNNGIVLSHLGDSRCYQFREKQIEQLTQDHTMLQKLLDEGDIDQEQFDTSPMHHIISQALGLKKQPSVVVRLLNPESDSMFLLCSDGLTNCISDAQIHYVMSTEKNLNACVDELITRANDHGGIDNISAVLVKINHKS